MDGVSLSLEGRSFSQLLLDPGLGGMSGVQAGHMVALPEADLAREMEEPDQDMDVDINSLLEPAPEVPAGEDGLSPACDPASAVCDAGLQPPAFAADTLPACLTTCARTPGALTACLPVVSHVPPRSPLPGLSITIPEHNGTPLISPLRQHVSGASPMHPRPGMLSPAQQQIQLMGAAAAQPAAWAHAAATQGVFPLPSAHGLAGDGHESVGQGLPGALSLPTHMDVAPMLDDTDVIEAMVGGVDDNLLVGLPVAQDEAVVGSSKPLSMEAAAQSGQRRAPTTAESARSRAGPRGPLVVPPPPSFASPPTTCPVVASATPAVNVALTPAHAGGPATPWSRTGIPSAVGGESAASCPRPLMPLGPSGVPLVTRLSSKGSATAVPLLRPACQPVPLTMPQGGLNGASPDLATSVPGVETMTETPAQPIARPPPHLAVRGPLGPEPVDAEHSTGGLSGPRSVGEAPPITPLPLNLDRRALASFVLPTSGKEKHDGGSHTSTQAHDVARTPPPPERAAVVRPGSAPARVVNGIAEDPAMDRTLLAVRMWAALKTNEHRLAEEDLPRQLEEAMDKASREAAAEAEAAAMEAAREAATPSSMSADALRHVIKRCQASDLIQVGGAAELYAPGGVPGPASRWMPAGSLHSLCEGAVRRILLSSSQRPQWALLEDEDEPGMHVAAAGFSKSGSPACSLQRTNSSASAVADGRPTAARPGPSRLQPSATALTAARSGLGSRRGSTMASPELEERSPSPEAPPTTSRKRRVAPPKRFDDEENASDLKRRRSGASADVAAARLAARAETAGPTPKRGGKNTPVGEALAVAPGSGARAPAAAPSGAHRDPLANLPPHGRGEWLPVNGFPDGAPGGYPPAVNPFVYSGASPPGSLPEFRPQAGTSLPSPLRLTPADVSKLVIVSAEAAPAGVPGLELGPTRHACCVGRVMEVVDGPRIKVAWYHRHANNQWDPMILGDVLGGGSPVTTWVDLTRPGNPLLATFAAFSIGKTIPVPALVEAEARMFELRALNNPLERRPAMVRPQLFMSPEHAPADTTHAQPPLQNATHAQGTPINAAAARGGPPQQQPQPLQVPKLSAATPSGPHRGPGVLGQGRAGAAPFYPAVAMAGERPYNGVYPGGGTNALGSAGIMGFWPAQGSLGGLAALGHSTAYAAASIAHPAGQNAGTYAPKTSLLQHKLFVGLGAPLGFPGVVRQNSDVENACVEPLASAPSANSVDGPKSGGVGGGQGPLQEIPPTVCQP